MQVADRSDEATFRRPGFLDLSCSTIDAASPCIGHQSSFTHKEGLHLGTVELVCSSSFFFSFCFSRLLPSPRSYNHGLNPPSSPPYPNRICNSDSLKGEVGGGVTLKKDTARSAPATSGDATRSPRQHPTMPSMPSMPSVPPPSLYAIPPKPLCTRSIQSSQLKAL